MGNTTVDCPTCWGGGNTGEDDDGNEIPCKTCGGNGTVTVSGED
jgi:DnaJ-class molecular chaperone